MKVKTILLVLAVQGVLEATAGNYTWQSGTGDIEYETATNWNPAGPPTASDTILAPEWRPIFDRAAGDLLKRL